MLGKFISALTKKHAIQTELDTAQLKHNLNLQTIIGVTNVLIPYLYLGYGAYAGTIALGDMTVLINAFGNARSMINTLANSIASLKESSLYVEHLKTILNYVPQIENQTDGPELRGDEITDIEFKNVSFKYPNSENYVLRNVNFVIRKGQKLALVGINGAGKTTLVKLLMRFYDPNEGSVTINGRDLREYDISSLRNAITTVFQEFQAYSLLVSELISCEEGEAIDDERVRRVLEQVGLYDKVSASEKGIHSEYSKYFDENGLVFSGGQIQKMIIARMLYKGSAVIVMDEPSSALDPESEYEINRDITRAAENKTVVMISHRLSTTKDADNIVLIENGEVREQGSHAELIAKNGRYAYLFNIQASEYVEKSYETT